MDAGSAWLKPDNPTNQKALNGEWIYVAQTSECQTKDRGAIKRMDRLEVQQGEWID